MAQEKNSKEPENLQDISRMQESYKSGADKKIDTSMQEKTKKEMEKTKAELEKIKKNIIKKYSFVTAIGLIPPQANEKFEEEEEIPESETKKKLMHLIVVVPDEKIKLIPKMQLELIKHIKEKKTAVWLHIKTPKMIFEYGLDSKFDLLSAIAMSFPLHDKGFLGALRVAEIHKTLVLRKFERYVTSYVIAGSLVRGTAQKTSDVDIYIVIDDTDVKRMPRVELREKLRAIIYQYVMEASELAGVKNKLSPQVYILTEFWEAVKDAHPVMFTFIRDGVPLYDRGTFLPWKLLLKMGKIKPSPESIDMFMSMGDKMPDMVKKKLLEIVVVDIFWSVNTPSQALLMLYGLPPPNVYETVEQMKKIFLTKEKMLEKKYIDILEEIAIKYYKGYEHEKVKEVSGKDVDRLLKNAKEYIKRLKELREQIEKRAQEKTIEQIYEDVFSLLKGMLKEKSEKKVIEKFDRELVKKGKFPKRYLEILKDITKAKSSFKKGKLAKHEVENARKNASVLINSLIEYSQRCELVSLEKGRMTIKYKEKDKEKKAGLILTDKQTFLIEEGGKISKITTKIIKSNKQEFDKALSEQKKDKLKIELNSRIFEILKKKFGNFEIIF